MVTKNKIYFWERSGWAVAPDRCQFRRRGLPYCSSPWAEGPQSPFYAQSVLQSAEFVRFLSPETFPIVPLAWTALAAAVFAVLAAVLSIFRALLGGCWQ
jgi:hypothetical protein